MVEETATFVWSEKERPVTYTGKEQSGMQVEREENLFPQNPQKDSIFFFKERHSIMSCVTERVTDSLYIYFPLCVVKAKILVNLVSAWQQFSKKKKSDHNEFR